MLSVLRAQCVSLIAERPRVALPDAVRGWRGTGWRAECPARRFRYVVDRQ